jgi:hypothetical protein
MRGEAIASVLQSPLCRLNCLNLSWNSIRSDSWAWPKPPISFHRSAILGAKSLWCCSGDLRGRDALRLCTSLWIPVTSYGPGRLGSAVSLGRSLSVNTSLVELDLQYNALGLEGVSRDAILLDKLESHVHKPCSRVHVILLERSLGVNTSLVPPTHGNFYKVSQSSHWCLRESDQHTGAGNTDHRRS